MKNKLKTYYLTACVFIIALPAFTQAETESKFSTSINGIYWRPTSLDFPVVAPITFVSGFAYGTGAAQSLEYDFAPGYRMTAQWNNLRIRWTDLQTSAKFATSCVPASSGLTGGSCIAAQTGSLSGEAGSRIRPSIASAASSFRLQIFDLDFLSPLGESSDLTKPTFTGSLGFRYARIFNNRDTLYLNDPAIAVDDIQTTVVDNMVGLRAGLDSEYRLHSKVRLAGTGAVSLLGGRSHSDSTEFESGGVGTSQTGGASYTMVPAFELAVKVLYTPIADLDSWLGFDFMQFNNALIFPGAVNGFAAQDAPRNVSMMGPSLGLRWRFD